MDNISPLNLLDILLDGGINIGHKNNYGTTAFKMAVNHHNIYWIKALLKKGSIMDIDIMELMQDKEWIELTRVDDYEIPKLLIIAGIIDQVFREEKLNLEPLNMLNEIVKQANKISVMKKITDQVVRGEKPKLELLNMLNKEDDQYSKKDILKEQVKNLLNELNKYEKYGENIFVTRLNSILHNKDLLFKLDIQKHNKILPIEFCSELEKQVENYYKTAHHITDNSSHDEIQATGKINSPINHE